jgi:LuxR family maltose regulon positive regulatory protein
VFADQIYLSQWIVAVLEGNLRGAEEASTQLVNLNEPRKLYEGCGWAFLTLGYIHYQWNDLAAAERYFSKILELRYQTNLGTQVHSSFGLALTYQAMGRQGEAAQIAEAAVELARETGNSSMLLEAYSFASRLALLGGQVPNTEYWAASLSEPFYMMLLIEIPHLTLAAARIALGTPSALKEANDLLTRVRQFVEHTHNKWRLIEVLALQALLHNAQDERETALTLLEQAVTLAQPGGFIRLFVDLGPAMACLLEKLREQGTSPDYIAQILAAFGMKDDADTGIRRMAETMDSSPLVESLTSRELEVLVLLDQHLTNKEIAEKLVVSPSTVKTHTLNLYRKFNVHGRQQAVAKARELEILPPDVV